MSLEYAILATLNYQPMTGYDLKKFFDVSVVHFWSATKSHIYKALNELERKGWTTSQVIPQEGKPNRNEYYITGDGRAELLRWLTTPLPLELMRHGWLVQIFFSYTSSNAEIASLLETRRDQIRSRLQVLRNEVQAVVDENAQQTGIERARELWQITLDYGLDYYEAELAWLDKTLERVRDLPP